MFAVDSVVVEDDSVVFEDDSVVFAGDYFVVSAEAGKQVFVRFVQSKSYFEIELY